MRINYHKSELIPINLEREDCLPFLEILECTLGSFPVKYLGIPLHHDKLHREDLQPLVDSLLLRMAGWRGKLLSTAAKKTLIQAVLASIPIYMLPFF
jgi:hypothetical protein